MAWNKFNCFDIRTKLTRNTDIEKKYETKQFTLILLSFKYSGILSFLYKKNIVFVRKLKINQLLK